MLSFVLLMAELWALECDKVAQVKSKAKMKGLNDHHDVSPGAPRVANADAQLLPRVEPGCMFCIIVDVDLLTVVLAVALQCNSVIASTRNTYTPRRRWDTYSANDCTTSATLANLISGTLAYLATGKTT